MVVLFHLVLGRTVVGPSPPARKLLKRACRAETIPALVNVRMQAVAKKVMFLAPPTQSKVHCTSLFSGLDCLSLQLN